MAHWQDGDHRSHRGATMPGITRSGSRLGRTGLPALLALTLLTGAATGRAETEALPDGNLFKPLLADPKRPRFYVSVIDVRLDERETTGAAVAYGGEYGLMRWPGQQLGDGWQLNLAGAVFAQFDLESPSMDLINADYTIGFPLSYRRGKNSLRLKLYHQSSHLGDEFLLRNEPERVNLSFESLEAILARDLGTWRLYAGGEYFVHRQPERLGSGSWHAGLDYRRAGPLWVGRGGGGTYPVLGVDTKAFAHHDWEPGWSVMAGVEIHPGLPGRGRDKSLSILGLWYEGPSPFGQFFTEQVNYWGLSVEFNL